MKQFAITTILASILAVFFIIGTATSPDIDFEEYEATVDTLGTNLILTSASNQAIDGAFLQLSHADANLAGSYHISDYSLGTSLTDTISFNDFINADSIPYPDSIAPILFNLQFQSGETLWSFMTDF